MRRRFGRGSRGNGDGTRAATVDPRWLEQVVAAGLVKVPSLMPVGEGELPDGFALAGEGTATSGERVLVAVARHGADAVIAALAVATKLAEAEDFRGNVLAVAPQWSAAARRRLGLAGDLPFALAASGAPFLAESPAAIDAEPIELAPITSARQVIRSVAGAVERELCARSVAGLEGLAAKHGGAVRGVGRSVELVLAGRRAAALRVDDEGVLLDTLVGGRRTTERLAAAGLSEALDRLEGMLRKQLNERDSRSGEDGLRARLVETLATSAGLRSFVRWPLGGSDQDAVDLVGVDTTGRTVVAAIRSTLGLDALGAILDGWLRLAPVLPDVLGEVEPPVRLDAPRLVIASERIDAAALRVLGALAIETRRFEIVAEGRDLVLRGGDATSAAPPRRAERPRRGERTPRPDARPTTPDLRAPREDLRAQRNDNADLRVAREDLRAGGDDLRSAGEDLRDSLTARRQTPVPPPAEDLRAPEDSEFGLGFSDWTPPGAEAPAEARPGRGRRGSRRRNGKASDSASQREAEPGEARDSTPAEDQPRFEEMSLFDLGDEDAAGARAGDDAASARPRRRRRGRGRSRGSREGGESSDAAGEGESDEEPEPEVAQAAPPREDRSRRNERGGRARAAADSDDDLDGGLVRLSPEAPEFGEEPEPAYEDDEGEEEPLDERERMRRERERRRRARLAKGDPAPVVEAPARPARPRRVAILAHADRDSLAAAILLARDQRMLDGVWVYPQSDLMTFFRGVAPDLRDDTLLLVVGFNASPARETLQTAALYRGRIEWFDHHPWPPEDLETLRGAIGADAVHVVPHTRSVLPLVLGGLVRRSRFSDKLVDLVAGRFTQHDFERWGRLWWWRLGEMTRRTGDRRAELEPLLVGRPSDLARDASAAAAPPFPDEVAFVTDRDFRLVHFGGHGLVVVPVPDEFDPAMCARIARERYAVPMSLAYREGQETFVLGADEANGRRALDVLGAVEHLAEKHGFVEALPDADHVARFRVADVTTHPERIEEVLASIAMGRSLLEG